MTGSEERLGDVPTDWLGDVMEFQVAQNEQVEEEELRAEKDRLKREVLGY